MQKRGQIFILAALLLGFIIFILVSETQYTRKTISDNSFEELNANYQLEAAKFVNELIKDPDADIETKFNGFTTLFTSYSKSQNQDFQLVFAFDFGGKFYIGNYLAKDIDAYIGVGKRITDLPGCFEEVKAKLSAFGLSLSVGGADYQKIAACSKSLQSPGMGEESYPIAFKIGEDDFWYGVDITVGVPEIIIIAREDKGEERKVFMKGRFLKGKEFEEEFSGKV